MAFDQKGLNDYVDVAQRIADFREVYPQGSLQPADPSQPFEIRQLEGIDKNGKQFTATMIVYTAAAYRTPDDQRPGIGMAWEPFPGRTPYTLGSELMNAETSAWGRAIVAALASDSKRGVSSREEIRNRQAERDEAEPHPRVKTAHTDPEHVRLTRPSPEERVNGRRAERRRDPDPDDPWAGELPQDIRGSINPGQRTGIMAKLSELGIKDRQQRLDLLTELVGLPVESTNDLSFNQAAAVLAGLKDRQKAAAS